MKLTTILISLSVCIFISATARAQTDTDLEDSYFLELSLEDLMNVEVEPSASLTTTSRKMIPGAVTTITNEDIQNSSTRSLDELLDIYVPNLQIIRSHWEQQNMGLRGIIGDRDDKYLLLVNGRAMNEKTHYGATTERDLPMLSEIHHIDIIRGPGSALYGPGAVSMVINVVTYNSDTFSGTEITSKNGFIENFNLAEIKHGRKFDNGFGLFLYGSIGRYYGASRNDAHQVYGMDFPSTSNYPWWDPAWGTNTGPDRLPGDGTVASEPMLSNVIANDRGAADGLAPIKIHAQLKNENWDFWTRYTQGGKQLVHDSYTLAREPFGYADYSQPLLEKFYDYKQLTNYIGYNTEISDDTRLEMSVSYDLTDYRRMASNQTLPSEAFREDKYYSRAILHHNFSDTQKTAFGLEHQHLELGYPSLHDYGNYGISASLQNQMPRWSTDMYSVLGEYQWIINEQFTLFSGARLDDHTYSSNMFSPRASLIYSINDRNTMKFMWSRSLRASFEEEMKAQAIAGASETEPEKLENFELRYEIILNQNLWFAASGYYYNLEQLGATLNSNNDVIIDILGNQKSYGTELEANYQSNNLKLGLSHGFTKLISFDLNGNSNTVVTASAYGYGKDLARWSNHITKLNASYKINSQWSVNGSMRVYWGFPGMQDYSDYLRDNPTVHGPRDTENWKAPYRGNYYLNLGLQYNPTDNLTLQLNGYNLLGFFDQDLNKRNYGSGDSADYRNEAAALGVTVNYRF